jgi:hypothetical protein
MHDTTPHEHGHDHAPHDHAHDHATHQHAHAPDGARGAQGEHDHVAGSPHTHAADAPHTHAQAAPHAHAPEQAPENTENLILDIGADTGALIIHAAVDRDQAEVEISPAGSGQARTHNIVRRREAVSGAVYAAVFPALTAGDYTVWRDAATPAGTVAVQGGRVASFRLN